MYHVRQTEIVCCDEIEKLKGLMVAFQMEYVGVYQYPPRSLGYQNGSGSAGLENLLKIVSGVECEKLQELIVWVQME